ncbi:hypothetical protein K0651_11180 [Ornithinimicrobium sp. Arc0846-15]|nr:hypothetical protein [Ornithinimicrobium laminariae]
MAQQTSADLSALLLSHRMGEDTTEQFRDFMACHGHHFPERPASVADLLDLIATRSAAAARMRNSMTPQQRAELDALSAHAFGSPELMAELNDLTDNVRVLRPEEDWDTSEKLWSGDSDRSRARFNEFPGLGSLGILSRGMCRAPSGTLKCVPHARAISAGHQRRH